MRQTDYGTPQIDINLYNDPYMLAFAAINKGATVLDLGCADGSFANILKRYLGCRVYGVEINEAAAKRASRYLDGLVTGDLRVIDLKEVFNNTRFDAIVFLDVLEHFDEPELLLENIKEVIDKDRSLVIASIPNATYLGVALSVLSGNFKYNDFGILDRTHLRFFDLDGIYKLFEDSGYEILSVRRVTRQLKDTEFKELEKKVDAQKIIELSQSSEAFTYQFSLVAKLKGGEARLEKGPLFLLQDSMFAKDDIIANLNDTILHLNEHIRGLEKALKDAKYENANLEIEITAIKKELNEKRAQLQHLDLAYHEKKREYELTKARLEQIRNTIGIRQLRALKRWIIK